MTTSNTCARSSSSRTPSRWERARTDGVRRCSTTTSRSGQSIGTLESVSRASLKSGRLAPATATPRVTPAPSVSRLRFVPLLARSVGLGPVFSPTQRCLRHHAVECLPVPLDAFQFLIGEEPTDPKLPEDPGPGPLLEAPVRGTFRTDAGGRQSVPLAAGTQDEEKGVHGRAVRHARVMAAQGVRFPWRDQWLDLGPEFIGYPPTIVSNHQSHGSSSFSCFAPGITRAGYFLHPTGTGS
jgi:hypothetical protein